MKGALAMKHLLNYILASKVFNDLKREEGMGTIEIVIIIAVLIGLAFLFRSFAVSFFMDLTEGIKDNNQINELFTSP